MPLTINAPTPVAMLVNHHKTIFDSQEWQRLESDFLLFAELFAEKLSKNAGNDALAELENDISAIVECAKTLLFNRLQEIENMDTFNSAILDEKAAILQKLEEL